MSELKKLVAEAEGIRTEKTFSGTFQEYYDLIKANPSLVETAHQRLYRSVVRHGVTEMDTASDARLHRIHGRKSRKIRQYSFFRDLFFGIDGVIEEIMDVLRAAAAGGEESRQILYLVGPVGTGKTSLVDQLKRALETSGPFYAIAGCPMHEEPLRLTPEHMRPALENKLGLRRGQIRGAPCPLCRFRLTQDFGNDFTRMPVESVTYSIQDERGIGVLPPADENSTDVSLLIGQIDMGRVSQFGENDPRTIIFNGALNRGERGLTDLYELNKNPTPLLHPLLSATQEKRYRAPGQHPMFSCDTVLLAHSNETELERFRKDKRNEALVDRMIFIRCKYTLERSMEQQILRKIIVHEADFRSDEGTPAHIAPLTEETVATFVTLSRLGKSAKVNELTKLKIYDGEEVIERSEKAKPVDIGELQAEAGPREGYTGLSTRFGTKAMGRALARVPGGRCVTPVHVLEVIAREINGMDGLPEEDRTYLKDHLLLSVTRGDYLDHLREHIATGFLHAYEDSAQQMLDEYLDHVFAYNLQNLVRDRKTGEVEQPNEEIMGALERSIGITGESLSRGFRAQVASFVGQAGTEPPGGGRRTIRWDAHERLREAIKRRLFDSVKQWARVISRASVLNEEDRQRYDRMVEQMQRAQGYCPHCVDVVLRFAHNNNLFRQE